MSEQGDDEAPDGDEPFGDLVDRIDRKRREEQRDPFDALDEDEDAAFEGSSAEASSIFTEETFDEVDSEELWDDLEEEPISTGHEEDDGEDVSTVVEEEDTHIVPKRSFCETCPHLAEPPEFRCTHEGTEIVEFVDTGHVRVSDCPIVEERQAERE